MISKLQFTFGELYTIDNALHIALAELIKDVLTAKTYGNPRVVEQFEKQVEETQQLIEMLADAIHV